jgi:hypothetical protein
MKKILGNIASMMAQTCQFSSDLEWTFGKKKKIPFIESNTPFKPCI